MLPLHGVRVVELGVWVAGPAAAGIMADWGADVVKIEPPAGDLTRFATPRRHGLSSYFVQQNVGKRSICIDLAKPDGQALIRRLATEADIVTENFRPGVMASFNVGWEDLRAVNPKLVMLSISGFGQDGPYRNRPGYDFMIQGMGGVKAVPGVRTAQQKKPWHWN